MKIESQVSAILIREMPKSSRPDVVADQQNSFTSEPIGDSSGAAAETASETTGLGTVVTVQSQAESVDVKSAVAKLNEIVQSQQTNVSFFVDEEADETVIKVFDTETGELIRQYPPEEILSMKAKLSQSLGALYDVTA